MAFRIAQWSEAHETHESRKLKALSWVAVPNKHDGLGFSQLKNEPDRVQLYCAWCLMLQLSSRSPAGFRGWLARAGRPLSARDMAMMTGFPEEIFTKALSYFARQEVGWLREENMPEEQELPGVATAKTAPAAALPAESPGATAPAAALPAESPGATAPAAALPENPPIQGRQYRQDSTGKTEQDKGGREALTLLPDGAPSLEEVRSWALSCKESVDPEFAEQKWREAAVRGDWDKPAVRKNWRARFAGFWEDDAAAWRKKNKKRAADGKAVRPDAWRDGDQEWWWNDSVADVKSALSSALAIEDTKTVARLREILAVRQK